MSETDIDPEDVLWIDQRANEIAHAVAKLIRQELVAHYGPENFPVISIQGRYEAAMAEAMYEAFLRAQRE